VIERLNPDRFLEAFLSWAEEFKCRNPTQINIDGKTLKKALDQKGALHLVSAFAAENGMVIGCKDAGGKGKEIPAIKELLESIILKEGDIVTIDAIGCQKEIISQIRDQQADYLIALKKNQEKLWNEVDNFFRQAFDAEDYAPVKTYKTVDSSHGREEIHTVWVTDDLGWLDIAKDWDGLSSLICIQREWSDGKEKRLEVRFYISSTWKTAEEFGQLVRRH
jgi:predicted transposase YbfD/YdcC